MYVSLFACHIETVFRFARHEKKSFLLISPVLNFLFHTFPFMIENACRLIGRRSIATLAEADSFDPIALCQEEKSRCQKTFSNVFLCIYAQQRGILFRFLLTALESEDA